MVKATNLYGNKAKGTHANKEVNKWGRLLQAQYMLSMNNEGDESMNDNDNNGMKISYPSKLTIRQG